MSKWFLTDELNDMYTVQVTNAKKAKIETGAGLFKYLSSAATTVNLSGQTISTGPCYLKSVILGQVPATASFLSLYDTTTSGQNFSAFGSSGGNIIARFNLDTSAGVCAAAALYPRVIPLDVYCASGLKAAIGEGHVYTANLSGCAKGITIIYQT